MLPVACNERNLAMLCWKHETFLRKRENQYIKLSECWYGVQQALKINAAASEYKCKRIK